MGDGQEIRLDLTQIPYGAQLPPYMKKQQLLPAKLQNSRNTTAEVDLTPVYSVVDKKGVWSLSLTFPTSIFSHIPRYSSFVIPLLFVDKFDGEWVQLTLIDSPMFFSPSPKVDLYAGRKGSCLISSLPTELWRSIILPTAFPQVMQSNSPSSCLSYQADDYYKLFCSVLSSNRCWHRILENFARRCLQLAPSSIPYNLLTKSF